MGNVIYGDKLSCYENMETCKFVFSRLIYNSMLAFFYPKSTILIHKSTHTSININLACHSSRHKSLRPLRVRLRGQVRGRGGHLLLPLRVPATRHPLPNVAPRGHISSGGGQLFPSSRLLRTQSHSTVLPPRLGHGERHHL
jgi:hypothetical protein